VSLIFPDSPDAACPDRTGGKGAALARLGRAGFDIPPWFAVPPETAVAETRLADALARLGGQRFAVRSSGAMEDGGGHSFAGQFESFLDVPASDIAARIADVRASARHDGILEYCRNRNLPAPDPPVALVQRMIEPRAAGVAFSADPVNGRRAVAVVAAVAGTAEKLVSGEINAETWRLDRPVGLLIVHLRKEVHRIGIARVAGGDDRQQQYRAE